MDAKDERRRLYVDPISHEELLRRNREAIALLDSWERDGDEEEQRATMAVLREALEMHRVAISTPPTNHGTAGDGVLSARDRHRLLSALADDSQPNAELRRAAIAIVWGNDSVDPKTGRLFPQTEEQRRERSKKLQELFNSPLWQQPGEGDTEENWREIMRNLGVPESGNDDST